jgi:hypothetical protein
MVGLHLLLRVLLQRPQTIKESSPAGEWSIDPEAREL